MQFMLASLGLQAATAIAKVAIDAFKPEPDAEPLTVDSRPLESAAVDTRVRQAAVVRWVASEYDPRALYPHEAVAMADALKEAGALSLREHQALTAPFRPDANGNLPGGLSPYDRIDLQAHWEGQFKVARASNDAETLPTARRLSEVLDGLVKLRPAGAPVEAASATLPI
jgi:hypothetical protein